MKGYKNSIAENQRVGYRKMIKWLNETLVSSRECFKREATYKWFIVVIIGLMIWQEHVGVTSFIRELWIDPKHYVSILHFFRSNAWKIETLRAWWLQMVLASGVLYYEFGMPILVGDGTVKNKFGIKMPCVKRLSKKSGNESRHYIFGHMFGAIGVLAGSAEKLFCIPLSVRIHDGDQQIQQWADENAKTESHVVRIIRESCQAAEGLKEKCLLLLDRYYLTVPALSAWLEEEKRVGNPLLSIIIRVKLNAKAYLKPERNPRGRPRKKGAAIKLINLVKLFRHQFTEANVVLYGKEEKISYYCVDLLWGQKLYRELRFVIICGIGSEPVFLASTDLTLSPLSIMRLYGYRFKIECSFRELKHTIAGFAYRFWSTAMPKLNRFAKSGEDPLSAVEDSDDKRLISSAYAAIQGFVMFGCIAHGLLQIGALLFTDEINAAPLRWLRTKTNTVPSEASTADYLRKTIFSMFHFSADFSILRLIHQLQLPSLFSRSS